MPQPPTNNRWEVDWNVDPDEVKAKYSESDRKRIFGAIEKHVSIHSGDRELILEVVFNEAVFFFIERQNEKRPTPQSVRDQLDKIRKSADGLIDAINSADELALFHLVGEMSGDKTPGYEAHPYAMDINAVLNRQVGAQLSKKFADLPPLSEAAKTALMNLPKGKPGQKPDWALHRFIRRQTTFFMDWVRSAKRSVAYDEESEKYYGPLFDYIEACLTPIDPNPERSNQALGSLILRALKYQHSTVKNTPTWRDWQPE